MTGDPFMTGDLLTFKKDDLMISKGYLGWVICRYLGGGPGMGNLQIFRRGSWGEGPADI